MGPRYDHNFREVVTILGHGGAGGPRGAPGARTPAPPSPGGHAARGGSVDGVVPGARAPGWAPVGREGPGATAVEAPIRVVDPAVRFGVLSDIDDTVMVTALPRPVLAAWNTFVLDEHARMAV